MALLGLQRLDIDPDRPRWWKVGGEPFYGTSADVYRALRFAERSEKEMQKAIQDWTQKPRQLPQMKPPGTKTISIKKGPL